VRPVESPPLPRSAPQWAARVNALVFLLDVDNTLLDNDRVAADLRAHLEHRFGTDGAEHYFAHFERLRSELGYADYLGALQRFRADAEGDGADQLRLLLEVGSWLVDYPFAERLYPRALDVVAHLSRFGPTVILSDGDVVFQPRKVERSGLWKAVDGRVLIYVHKERMLDQMQTEYPARHYVMVDDKVRILSAMKAVMGDRLTTVFPRQGHYALDAVDVAKYPPADVTVECIADLLRMQAWPP